MGHISRPAYTASCWISFADRNTRAVFGDYVDIYDLTRAVGDGATVPVFFEPRLIKVGLKESVSEEDLDRAADDVTVGLDAVERAQLEKSVAVVNAIYGSPDRIRALAEDLVAHWEARRQAMQTLIGAPGKGLIVGGTRVICAKLYQAIIELRPDWHADELERGLIKVVYSGDATDTEPIRRHVRRESENATIKARLREPDDALELVIVKDMMLTGYDSPPLHTLYLDRPLKGALLMQTLARVNRTFRGKNAGLLVGYAPLAENLQRALDEYTEADRAERPVGRDLSEVIDLVQQLLGLIREAVVGFDWRSQILPSNRKSWFEAAMGMTNYLRSATTSCNQVPEGEERLADRYRRLSGRLTRGWALSSGTDALAPLRNEVLFYEEVRVYMAKFDAEERRASGQPVPEEIQRLLAAVIADSTETGDVVDIYEAAGIPKPELSELTPEFAARAQQATNPQLAIEALRKAILEEIGRVTRSNLVRERVFSERVTALMNRYTNSQLPSAEVIAELLALAKEVSAESRRGANFHPALDHDQLAFYDAVAANESAVLEQGEDVLAQIARELVAIMRRDVRTDWTVREDVRAKLRSSIKRLLVKYDYPPDKQPGAIKLVMEQMEQLAPHYVDSRY
jgi:type I restriction enzyme, R subunit